MLGRIQLLLKIKNLSSSQFADEIGVQRSSISHIISGRNNPSLEFLMKILNRYPELQTDWLLFGNGSMFKESSGIKQESIPELIEKEDAQNLKSNLEPDLFSIEEIPPPDKNVVHETTENISHIPTNKLKEEDQTFYPVTQQKEANKDSTAMVEKIISENQKDSDLKKIKRIILLFNDGSFETYS